jgi:selenoprotein W-related protein
LLEQYGHDITELVLVPSRSGVFEVDVDDTRVFSKDQLGRHANPGEVLAEVGKLAG